MWDKEPPLCYKLTQQFEHKKHFNMYTSSKDGYFSTASILLCWDRTYLPPKPGKKPLLKLGASQALFHDILRAKEFTTCRGESGRDDTHAVHNRTDSGPTIIAGVPLSKTSKWRDT